MAPDDVPQMPIREIAAFESNASAVCTGHGGFVFSCSKSAHVLALHDSNTGDKVVSLEVPAQSPSCIAVSHDGVKCAYGTAAGTVYLWDVIYPTSMESFLPEENFTAAITHLSWHPRGHVLAVATTAGYLYLWDLVVGALLYPVPAHDGPISAVKWTDNGRLLVTAGGTDSTLRIWNPRNVDNLAELSAEAELSPKVKWHTSGINALDTLYDRSRVAISGANDGSVLLSAVKPETAMCGVFHSMTSHTSPVSAVCFAPIESPKPLRAASAATDGSLHLFDMDRLLPMGKFMHSSEVKQLEFSSHADVLFSAAGDTVMAWDARVAPEEENPVTFAGHPAPVDAFSITNHGASLVTACQDGVLRSFDMRYPAGDAPVFSVDAK